MKNKNLIFSIVSVIIFVLIALFYVSPVLSGKAIIQPDIVNHVGSAQEMYHYQKETGENIYWSNSMFSGMPTYQIGASYDFDFIKKIDKVFRFLPRPADYIFLLFAGFFILGMTLFKNWKYALVGSLFFAFCAYFFIIIAAGHNAKVHSIAYFAPLVAGILLLYRGKFILGFILTTLFMGLELSANHPQMTFYLFLAMLIYFIVELIQAIKLKKLKTFSVATALVIAASLIGVGLNASRLLSTYEYSKETIRGNSEMTLLSGEGKRKGLDKDYITNWSYGKLETFNLFVPNFMGGASSPDSDNLKNYIKELRNQQYLLEDEFDEQLFQYIANNPVSTYWGQQPSTSGPAYQGAVVVLLFFLGLFLVSGKWSKYKWWLLGATSLSILLAWGKNFEWFTNLFIDYFPFYNKFRAVSSILVIAEFTMPLLAIFALYSFFKDKNLSEEYKKKVLLYAGGTILFVLIIIYLLGGAIFNFTTDMDAYIKMQFIETVKEYNPNALGKWNDILTNLNKALTQDRIDLLKADTLRTIIFVVLTLALLLAYQFKMLKQKIIVIIGIGILVLIDGWTINKRYLNDDNFVAKSIVENPFPTEISTRLMNEASKNVHLAGIAQRIPYNKTVDSLRKSDDAQFRVYDNIFSTFNEAATSYFVSSIGGYHGAKLSRYQDIIDLYFTDGEHSEKFNLTGLEMKKLLDMLNTKYIVEGTTGSPMVSANLDAFGNAWLTSNVHWVKDANEEILALKDVNLRNSVILREDLYPELKEKQFAIDGNSDIELVEYRPDKLTYKIKTSTPQMAVFSEIYYPYGWQYVLDSEGESKKNIYKANYLLRAIPIDAGEHTLVMEFKPGIIKTGNVIALISSILLILIILGGSFLLYKEAKTKKTT